MLKSDFRSRGNEISDNGDRIVAFFSFRISARKECNMQSSELKRQSRIAFADNHEFSACHREIKTSVHNRASYSLLPSRAIFLDSYSLSLPHPLSRRLNPPIEIPQDSLLSPRGYSYKNQRVRDYRGIIKGRFA